MSHFFVKPDQITDATVVITGSDVNHIKNVLRKKVGQDITVSDGVNPTYTCRISAVSSEAITAQIISRADSTRELPARIVLFQGLAKSDKLEFIIQKAVELGASEIVPVAMKNSVMKIQPEKAQAKVNRWQAIAQSAAKQSGRNVVPDVAMPMSFDKALEYSQDLEMKILTYENKSGMEYTREVISQCPGKSSIGVWVGPEGGYTPEEVEKAQNSGWLSISLGRRILRTETAGLATLAMLVYILDE